MLESDKGLLDEASDNLSLSSFSLDESFVESLSESELLESVMAEAEMPITPVDPLKVNIGGIIHLHDVQQDNH